MANDKSKILIIEDDPDVAEMLNAYFCVQGFEVLISNWGEEGVSSAVINHPDLVILDIRLPDIDGYEVAKRLRADRRSINIPIIFLTEKRDRADRLQGLEIGADDYITKPFDIQELRLRVRNSIQRAGLNSLTNPITGLPEGDVVLEQIRDALKLNNWAILLISLENVDNFQEQYGFVASDDVIRAVSLMINNIMSEFIARDCFFGHFSSNEFIVITNMEKCLSLADRIKLRLNQALEYFYPIKDREEINHRDDRMFLQIFTLTINDSRDFSVDDIVAEFKKRK